MSSSLSTRAKMNKGHYLAKKNRNQMAGLTTYIKESFEELKNHVSWTPWPEAQRLSVIVAVFSIIFSLAIWGVDTVFSRAVKAYFEFIN
ncbi:preprotein translocase subunit SecE [Winogradskyella sp. PE311]|uniref:preprotein translocase subunit SecE n=1 Tax=Winogradskyella sp. PE311 TaxID=3366943 RepID=UPI00397EF817